MTPLLALAIAVYIGIGVYALRRIGRIIAGAFGKPTSVDLYMAFLFATFWPIGWPLVAVNLGTSHVQGKLIRFVFGKDA